MMSVLAPSPPSAPMGPFVPLALPQAQAQDYFAFARIADDVCLVQGTLPSLPKYPTR